MRNECVSYLSQIEKQTGILNTIKSGKLEYPWTRSISYSMENVDQVEAADEVKIMRMVAS